MYVLVCRCTIDTHLQMQRALCIVLHARNVQDVCVHVWMNEIESFFAGLTNYTIIRDYPSAEISLTPILLSTCIYNKHIRSSIHPSIHSIYLLPSLPSCVSEFREDHGVKRYITKPQRELTLSNAPLLFSTTATPSASSNCAPPLHSRPRPRPRSGRAPIRPFHIGARLL